MCHTRELAFQISKEYERFSKFLPAVKVTSLIMILFMIVAKVPRWRVVLSYPAFLYLCNINCYVTLAWFS